MPTLDPGYNHYLKVKQMLSTPRMQIEVYLSSLSPGEIPEIHVDEDGIEWVTHDQRHRLTPFGAVHVLPNHIALGAT